MPSDTYTRITGDIKHLQVPLPCIDFWHILHAITTSRIYLTRCDVRFARTPTILAWQRLQGNIVSGILTDLANCIRASWTGLRAASCIKGRNRFRKCWQQHFGDFYVSISPVDRATDDGNEEEHAESRYAFKLCALLT